MLSLQHDATVFFYFSLNWYQNQPLHLWGLSTAEACAGGSHVSEEQLRDKGVQNA